MIGKNKGRYSVWLATTIEWRQKYGAVDSSHQPLTSSYDPSRIRVSTKQCAKCDSLWKITRHHKGHEYVFACIREDWYAARYIQFLSDDIVPLCERCHIKIHNLYAPILADLNHYLDTLTSAAAAEHGVLEVFRKRMVKKCDNWLKTKMKKPSKGTKKRLK